MVAMCLGLAVLIIGAHRHDKNIKKNWQLEVLPQPGGREFNPRWVHDNVSVPLWVYMRFLVSEHQN